MRDVAYKAMQTKERLTGENLKAVSYTHLDVYKRQYRSRYNPLFHQMPPNRLFRFAYWAMA